jgi:hypothetical protein
LPLWLRHAAIKVGPAFPSPMPRAGEIMVQPSEAATECEVTRPGGRVRMTGSGHEVESGERERERDK